MALQLPNGFLIVLPNLNLGQYTKDERRQIHQLIASSFGKFLETRTSSSSEDDEHRVITIRRKPHLDKTPQSDCEDAAIITGRNEIKLLLPTVLYWFIIFPLCELFKCFTFVVYTWSSRGMPKSDRTIDS